MSAFITQQTVTDFKENKKDLWILHGHNFLSSYLLFWIILCLHNVKWLGLINVFKNINHIFWLCRTNNKISRNLIHNALLNFWSKMHNVRKCILSETNASNNQHLYCGYKNQEKFIILVQFCWKTMFDFEFLFRKYKIYCCIFCSFVFHLIISSRFT